MHGIYQDFGFYLPTNVLLWIAQSQLRHWVYQLQPVYGAIRFLHLIGTVGFAGLAALFNCRSLGLLGGLQFGTSRRSLVNALNTSFAATLVTGVVLFLYDPLQIGSHTMFLPKLVLTTLGFLIAYWPHRRSSLGPRLVARPAFAAASLAIWIAVIGCSTWNRVERPLSLSRSLDRIDIYKQ